MTQHRERPAFVMRRAADGAMCSAPTWESLTERLIREAQAAGRFEDLPHHGERLPLEDDTLAGDMAVAFHVLRNAGIAPPWVEADREVRRLEAAIDTLITRASEDGSADATRRDGRAAADDARRARHRIALEALLAEHTAAVDRLACLAPGPRRHRRRLDRACLLARLERRSPGVGRAAATAPGG